MSNHLISQCYKRQIGTMARKAVMVLMADKASDDGRGIYAAKQTMAEEIGATKQTVISTIKSLIADGLLIEVGQRRSPNGYTVEYAIDVDVLEALPLTNSHAAKGSKNFTGQTTLPVKPVNPTGQTALPDQSNGLTQTPQNPPEPKEDGGSNDPLTPDDLVETWNEFAPRHGLPTVRGKLNKARRAQAKARIREYPDPADWARAFQCIAAAKWMHGDNDRGWRADFDFLIQAKSLPKLVEQSYGKN